MALSFRTARKLWMGFIALLSLIGVFLAVVLWIHGYSSSNFGALIAIPCLAFVGAVWTILRKTFFSPQPVCVEATWVFALLPFQILLGLFASEADSVRHSHLVTLYIEVLVTLVWINAVLVFLYATGIMLLALLTQLSCDQEFCSFMHFRSPPRISVEPWLTFERVHLLLLPAIVSRVVLVILNPPKRDLRVRILWKAFQYAYQLRWRDETQFM